MKINKEMDQDEFSESLKRAYREAIDNADAILHNAARIREEAVRQLEEANAKLREAEKQADRLIGIHYESKRLAIEEAAKLTFVRDLVRLHLENGKSEEEISYWTQAPRELIDAVYDVVKRVDQLRYVENRDVGMNARVIFSTSGRGGTVEFENDETAFDMWWEFAGGDASVIIAIPSPVEWKRKTGLPLDRRDGILQFIAIQVLREQFPHGHFLVGESVITFYSNP